MTMGDRIKPAGDQMAGRVKDTAAKVTGDQDLEARGNGKQAAAKANQAADEMADVAQDAFRR